MGLQIRYLKSAPAARTSNRHNFHYQNGCKFCPLRNQPGRMEPYGSKYPVVYMLGEAPGRTEIERGRPFVGVSGQLLRLHMPKYWRDNDERLLRWNNCVRSRPPNNRTPTSIELASCRKSIEDDIMETKPQAIFGFGAVPLEWALNWSGISNWTGRRIPIKVGDHTCWFFPLYHPSYINRSLGTDKPIGDYRSNLELVFAKHLRAAFNAVRDGLDKPKVYTRDELMRDINWVKTYRDSDVERIASFLERAARAPTAGVDIETNALRPYNEDAKILTAAVSIKGETLAWPIEHRQACWNSDQLLKVHNAFFDFLERSKCTKAVHNAAFEQEWAAVLGGRSTIRSDTWACTMSQAYILDERQASTSPGPQSLAWLTLQYLGVNIKKLNPIDRANLDETDVNDVCQYNGLDAVGHRLLYLKQRRRLREENLTDVFRRHMQRVQAAVATQIQGLPLDFKQNKKLLKKYEKQREEALSKIKEFPEIKEFYRARGEEYQPSRNPDTKYLVTKILPRSATRDARDKDGQIPNVTEATLELIKHPLAKAILAWRKPNKVITTYLNPLREDSDLVFDDGKLHPVTRTTTTRTWRTSSDGPNYQNFPKRDDERKEVRKQVKAGKGKKIVSFDYSGMQARNVAMESKCEGLIKAFKERYDIHSDWVEEIARIHPKWVKEGVKKLAHDKNLFKAYRNKVKQDFVFSSLFGAKPATIAYYIKAETRIGEKLQEKLWRRFPGVPRWHARLERMYEEKGYVQGLCGFRRRAPMSHNEIINAPIQGDESAIVCDVFHQLFETRVWALQPVMEIHDDLTFIWREKDIEENARRVISIMLNPRLEWAKVCPIGVEWQIGDNWAEQTTMGEYFSDTWDGKL